MARHELLDNITHKDLRVYPRYARGHGFDQQLARVFPIELGSLQAEYPLFLTRNAETEQYDLVALLGFEPDENLYLGGEQWLARTIPMSIERHPFLIGFDDPNQNQPVIHVDLDHPAISRDQGQPVFLPHGGESVLLERISELLGHIHEGHQASEAFSRTLSGLELIESLNLEVTLDNGESHTLNGLFTINEERLRALNAESLALLNERGYLQHIYMLLASMPQLAVLIERKNAQIEQASE